MRYGPGPETAERLDSIGGRGPDRRCGAPARCARTRPVVGLPIALGILLTAAGSACAQPSSMRDAPSRPVAVATPGPSTPASTPGTPAPASPSPPAPASANPSPASAPASPSAIPTPASAGVATAVPACCQVDLPSGWTLAGPNGAGAYTAQGSSQQLTADFQDVGPATSCPAKPANVVVDGEGYAVTGTASLAINGEVVTVWFSSNGDPTYEWVNADVVIGAACFDIGGVENGVASPANRLILEQIMSSVQPSP